MKNIKVLHTEWSDGWGGQEIRIVNEMLALRELGIELYLVCKDHAQIKQKALQYGFEVFTLPFRGNTDFTTLLGLIQIIRQKNIDIVNTHSGKDTWVGGIAAKITNVKFIRTRHLSNQINPSRFNFINGLADYILTTGESVKEDMITNNRIQANKISSIPTGIDANIFNPDKFDKSEAKTTFNIASDEIAIGNVGVLRSFKRHDIFIDVAKKLLDNFPNKKFKFLIAGEGPQREQLETKLNEFNLNDHIVLLGHIDNVAEFLSAIDIFLFTSDSKEGVPQSIMQALLMKKPVIATDVGSTKDLFHENNFLLCQPQFESLYKNIVAIINQHAAIQINRKYIEENFSKKTMADKIYTIYKELLA
jgi:glycosyltransferase involved in cell wall biosynthesis